MRGQILGVDQRTGEGVVAGDDGARYTFRQDDWSGSGGPAIGLQVDFETDAKRARSLFPVPGAAPVRAAAPAPSTDRNKYVAAILAFFLGVLGIHRFYLGRTGSGIAMLVLTMTLIGILVTSVWALVDTVRYLVMSDREFALRYERA
jgi:TM2 domain-containing membrane protein YozV